MARQVGSTNKRTVAITSFTKTALQRALKSTNITPLEFMLSVMRGTKYDMTLRFEAAKAAAPYVHAKIAQKIELEDTTSPENRQPINLMDLARTVAFLLAKARADQEADAKTITMEPAE